MNSDRAKHFYNEGFGWICRRCESSSEVRQHEGRSRLMTEGESELRSIEFSTQALAKWADKKTGILECPHCGTRERIPQER